MANYGSRRSGGAWLVFFVFLIIVVLWVASLFLVPWAARMYYGVIPCDEHAVPGQVSTSSCDASTKMSAYGTFGDSFGAINALFSGLALGGVVLSLFLSAEAARRATKPFVIPKMHRTNGEARVSVGEPTRNAGMIRLPIEVEVPLQNSGGHPALNVDLCLSIDGAQGSSTESTDLPLIEREVLSSKLSVFVDGEEARRFVEALCGEGAQMHLKVEYDSVEGVRWACSASYRLRANAGRAQDAQLLRSAVDGGGFGNDHGWMAEATVDLDFDPVPGSWKYVEVKPAGT